MNNPIARLSTVGDYDDGFKAGFRGRPNDGLPRVRLGSVAGQKPKNRKSLPHLALAMKLSVELACGRHQFE
jgi:hypothetical protein